MKISIALSVLILATGAMFGWHDRQQLVTSRETHAKLAADAPRFGISIDPQNPADPVRLTKRGERAERENKDAEARLTKRGERTEHENKDAEARLAAKDLIAIANENEKTGGPRDEAMQKKSTDLMAYIMSLDAGQWKILIAEVKASNDLNLKDEAREILIGSSIMDFANYHPQAALVLQIESLTDSSGVFKTDGMGMDVISTSLAKWAKDDPLGALDWVRKNGEKYRALITDSTKRAMIFGAAANDPKLAFQLIGDLGLKEDAVSSIVDAAIIPEERTATLAAFRAHLASLPEGDAREEASRGGIRSLVVSAAKEGFEAASQWIASAGFTPEQLASITGGDFSRQVKTEDTGKWIEWMGKNLPSGKSNDDIQQMVRHWTTDDYHAAGKWLAATPDGPAKIIFIRSYAETVANNEPQTAGLWAMTLPPGKDRDETLKNIYGAWPEKDDAAKEAFAKEHGIE